MMVSLSMGVLQCNLFANVSTVAGEPHFNSLCSCSFACGCLAYPGPWAGLPTV